MSTLKVNLAKYFSKDKRKKYIITLVVVLITIFGLAISFRKTITLVVDGEKRQITTYRGTVQGALHDQGIILELKDKVEPSIESKISKNDTINIKKAVNISVTVDGQDLEIMSAEDNVYDMLLAEGISIDSDDKILPAKEKSLEEGLDIEIVRVVVKEVSEVIPVEYETIVKSDESYLDSYSRVLKDGQHGEKKVISKITYENGEEVSKTVLEEMVLREPINKEVLQGTLKTLSANRGTAGIDYRKKINVKATAYSPINGATVAYTASGMKAARNANGYSTIAVDPNIIPLGTKVYVDGYGYAIAADTGSSVKGNFIDVFFNSYSEACAWGVKYLDVYIL